MKKVKKSKKRTTNKGKKGPKIALIPPYYYSNHKDIYRHEVRLCSQNRKTVALIPIQLIFLPAFPSSFITSFASSLYFCRENWSMKLSFFPRLYSSTFTICWHIFIVWCFFFLFSFLLIVSKRRTRTGIAFQTVRASENTLLPSFYDYLNDSNFHKRFPCGLYIQK